MPAKSLKELVAWVKANPDKGSYGTPAAGALPHFFAVAFAKAAGLDIRHVSYRGSAAAMADVVAGQIPIIVTTTADVTEQHKGGRIRVLATSDKERSPFLPDIPTFKEAGYDIVGSGWYGLYAPAKTPPDMVARLNKAIVAAVQTPEVKQRLLAFALVPTGTSAAEHAKIQKDELRSLGPRHQGFGILARAIESRSRDAHPRPAPVEERAACTNVVVRPAERVEGASSPLGRRPPPVRRPEPGRLWLRPRASRVLPSLVELLVAGSTGPEPVEGRLRTRMPWFDSSPWGGASCRRGNLSLKGSKRRCPTAARRQTRAPAAPPALPPGFPHSPASRREFPWRNRGARCDR